MITVIKTLIQDAKAYIAIHFFNRKVESESIGTLCHWWPSTHVVFLNFISKAYSIVIQVL